MATDLVSPPTAGDVRAALAAVASPEDAVGLAIFFKNGPGQYGEGDVFIGVRVPQLRLIARQFSAVSFDDIDALLDDPEHEHRLIALVLLTTRFSAEPDEVVRRYLAALSRGRVNNWDLVDLSAHQILGTWLLDKPRDLLVELATSPMLWERRVAIVSTFAFIRAGDASTTFALAELLLADREPLMHKAVGWMLREVGKRVGRDTLLSFLDSHAGRMPRTALSYATEHLSPSERAAYRAVPRVV